jgi:dTDP-4-dehydrorhamnose reductase
LINLFRLIKLKNQDSNGSFAWQKNQKMKIALFYKPSTMKACISVFVLMYIFCQPSLASAGFLSDLVDKIVGNKTQASEIEPANTEVIHNSQNVPLLESSINPDLKNIKDEPTPVSISSNTALSNNGNLDVDSELEKYDSNVKITTYTVKKGDTLDSIAKKLKISKATIIASNTDLKKSDLLKVGQPLAIFGIKPDVKEVPVKNEKTIVKKEEEPKAYQINVVGTRNVARVTAKMDIPLVFVSTNEVFDGSSNSPYKETDVPHPKTVVGKDKYKAEQVIQKTNRKYIIIRTMWLYSDWSENFIHAIIKKAKNNSSIKLVYDEIGSPTNSNDLAKAILKLIKHKKYGIYHITNKGSASRLEFGREILKQLHFTTKIQAIPLVEFKRLSKPPLYSVLDL